MPLAIPSLMWPLSKQHLEKRTSHGATLLVNMRTAMRWTQAQEIYKASTALDGREIQFGLRYSFGLAFERKQISRFIGNAGT